MASFINIQKLLSPTSSDIEKAYHRLDVGINWSRQTKKLSHQLSLGVQNVYNQKNNYFSYLLNDELNPEFNGRESKRALPVLPNLSYRLSF